MLNKLIEFSLRHRLLICLATLVIAVLGVVFVSRLPIDAFPDTTPVQVQINTYSPALTPVEIEQQITLPVELEISGLPGLENVRSVSKFGFSQVTATFSDDTDLYLARQLVSERLQSVELPKGLGTPALGPISTGLGEVFHYLVTSTNNAHSLTDLREVHDWVIKPELLKVPGVAEVNSWGGYKKQFHVVLDPEQLIKFQLTLDDVVEALRTNNRNVGGGQITRSGESLLVHGIGLTTNTREIGNIVLKTEEGTPVVVSDVAKVKIGHEIRRGAVTAGGRGEAVLGLGFMLMGENSHEVTTRLNEQLQHTKSSLPEGMEVEVLYDRTELVDKVIETVTHNLTAGAILVVAVLFAFLGNFRAGLIVAAAIPLSMMFAGNLMLQVGIAASLLSLGAIDFGLVVDSSVIMVENCARRAAESPDAPRMQIIRDAAVEVRKPTLFGELIIMMVFLPILTLEGVEGKMFRPMALTMMFALLGSLILSLTLMPVLASYFLPRRPREKQPWIVRLAQSIYQPVLRRTVAHPLLTVLLAGIIVLIGAWGASRLGTAFLPKLNEGALVVNVIRLAGVSIEESVKTNTRMEQLLLEHFPDEIKRVWSRIGSAEVATDPMGIELTDIFIALHPRSQWTRAATQGELVTEIDQLLGDFPGVNMAFTQPIEMRMNEMIAGIRSDIGIKIFGDDLSVLRELSDRVQQLLLDIPGAADVSGEQVTGQPVLRTHVDPARAARFGIPISDILDAVQSVGVLEVGEIRQGQRRFPLAVRWTDAIRSDPELVSNLFIPSRHGPVVRLNQVAEIAIDEGPATIQREWSRRRLTVQCNVRNRDLGSFLGEAQEIISEKLSLPDGYTLEWGGQFENMQRANARLMLVVPTTLLLVFVLLYLSLRSWGDVLLVATGIPFGMVGGVAALGLRGMPLTVSAAIGFIALCGIAILNGLVLVTFIRQQAHLHSSYTMAIQQACIARLRPVLMTALVAAVGFLPMAVNTGFGAEVQRPLATVVVGGIITNTLLTLLVLPSLILVTRNR